MNIIPFRKLIRIMPKVLFVPGADAVYASLMSRWETWAGLNVLPNYVSIVRIQNASLFEMKMGVSTLIGYWFENEK